LAWTHWKHKFQLFLYCCMFICFCRHVFTAPLSSNGRIYSFNYSSFQPSCHNMVFTVLSTKILNHFPHLPTHPLFRDKPHKWPLMGGTVIGLIRKFHCMLAISGPLLDRVQQFQKNKKKWKWPCWYAKYLNILHRSSIKLVI
jgi:hypothetical protein